MKIIYGNPKATGFGANGYYSLERSAICISFVLPIIPFKINCKDSRNDAHGLLHKLFIFSIFGAQIVKESRGKLRKRAYSDPLTPICKCQCANILWALEFSKRKSIFSSQVTLNKSAWINPCQSTQDMSSCSYEFLKVDVWSSYMFEFFIYLKNFLYLLKTCPRYI